MLPIIYLSDSGDAEAAYLKKLISTGKYLPYYIFRIEPIKTEISIDQIRAVKKEIVTATPHARLFIISEFDTASLEAQNAFLKTLEEKNEHNLFVMVVKDLGRVLPTIQSRSKIVSSGQRFMQDSKAGNVSDLFTKLEKNPDLSFLTEVATMNRENAIHFFDQAILYLEKELHKEKLSAATLLRKALQQKSLLLNNNLNPQLAVDSFLIFAFKLYKRP